MVHARREVPRPEKGKPVEGSEELTPSPEAEREAQMAARSPEERIELRRKEIAARARFIAEGMGSLEDAPKEIAALLKQEVDGQVEKLAAQVLDNVLEADTTGALREALARSEVTLKKERGELSPTEQLKATLTTRLEWLVKQGALRDERQMSGFVTGMERAASGMLGRMKEVRKQKRPPSHPASRGQPEAGA